MKNEEKKDKKALITQAEGKIRLAVERLTSKYPFHAAVINRMPILPKEGIGTMAVTFGMDSIVLVYEPAFVVDTPLKFLVGDLQHEVHHIIFRHLLMTRKDYPNRKALIIAQEVTVNEFVKEPIQDWVINLDKHQYLPPMESTIERYHKLDKMMPMITVQIKLPGGGTKGSGGHSDTHDASDAKAGSGGYGASDQPGKKPDPDAPTPGAGSGVMDNHAIWEIDIFTPTDEEAQKVGKTKEEMVDEIIQEACADVGAGEISSEILEACKNHGTEPGGMVERIQRGGKPDPWTILRRYVGQETAIRPIFTRPPRRFPDLVGVLPAYSRGGHQPKIMAVIDTSGSINSRMLSQMDANLRFLSNTHEITLVECDAMIYRVYPFKGLKDVHGRGGTDFRPPLEPAFLRKHKPDLVLFFTDGYGPAPERPAIVPVIWAILPYGQAPCTWGRFVFLKNS